MHANVYCLQSFSMYYIAKSVVSSLPIGGDPDKETHEQARVKAAANLRRLDRSRQDSEWEDDSEGSRGKSQRPRSEDLVLDQYESQIAMEVVAPEDIPVGFDGAFPLNKHLEREC
jgi:ATPase family AAA domain-containing protein 1